MEKQIHPLIAKYAGSIDSKLTLKLSEEEIKEQEQEFERIKSFMTNHNIPRLHSILFNQTEEKMELTKQDKKHIEERVRKLSFRIVDDAQDYMKLYERTYYEEVIKMCQEKIDTIDALKGLSRKYSEKWDLGRRRK